MKKLLLIIALLAPLALPGTAKAVEFGGIQLSPPISWDPTLEGCRKAHVWDTGRYPALAALVAYRFHVELHFCWGHDLTVFNEWGIPIQRGRPFWRGVWIRHWWTDRKSTSKIDNFVDKGLSGYRNCRIDGQWVRRGCYYLSRTGQVEHKTLGGIVIEVGHPQVEILFDAAGHIRYAGYDTEPPW